MKPEPNNNYGDRLREVMNTSTNDKEDISSVWKDQEVSEARRQSLENEYRKTKIKLKQNRKELRDEYFDRDQIEGKVRTLTEKLHKKLKQLAKTGARHSKSAPIWAKVSIVIVLLVGGIFVIRSSSQTTGTLGVSSGESGSSLGGGSTAPELPKEEAPFDLLYREGIDKDLYDVARVSPSGSAEAYTYLDRLSEGGVVFRVTQQKVPANFNLATVAEDFQTTNVIQVDDTLIYHGYSEKGRTQSILFVKNGLLVLVRSPEKLTDDKWASYFLSLI